MPLGSDYSLANATRAMPYESTGECTRYRVHRLPVPVVRPRLALCNA